jgi:ABC-2 type transport system ATP-binding protein
LADFSCAIRADALYKKYGRVQALDGASLVFSGGIGGLVGPNGAGKTTLLKVLLGLVLPDSGTAHVMGRNIARESLSVRREVGVLHERPVFPKALSGLEYLGLASRFYRTHNDPHDALSMVGLDDASDRPLGQLSTGMLQRFGLAHALIGQPRLVLLDEPTSNLDVRGKDDVIRLILDLNSDDGVSFLISSHTLPELQRLCHSVSFLRSGEVVVSGDVRGVLRDHTVGRYQIFTSDPRLLASGMRGIPGVDFVRITGVNTITFKIQNRGLQEIRKQVEAVANRLGTDIYAFASAETLEDVYMELMSDNELAV